MARAESGEELAARERREVLSGGGGVAVLAYLVFGWVGVLVVLVLLVLALVSESASAAAVQRARAARASQFQVSRWS